MNRIKPGVGGLYLAQLLGSFNDFAWKFAITFLLQRALPADNAAEAMQQLVTTMTVVFGLPLALAALPSIVVADRVPKRTLLIAAKALEFALMLAGAIWLAFRPEGGVGVLIIVGAMGAQSALFSPAKYAILPDIVPHHELSRANANLELVTLLGLIAGTAAGGKLLEISGTSPWIIGAVLSLSAAIGCLSVMHVPAVPASRSGESVAATVKGALSAIRAVRVLALAIVGNVLFFGIANLLSQNVLVYSRSDLGLSEERAAIPLAVMSVGLGLGCWIAGRLSARKVEVGLLPLGAIGLAASTLMFGLVTPGLWGTLALMVPVGVAGGLLVVPLNALIQWHSPSERRGPVIAVSNFFLYLSVLGGSLASGLLGSWHFSTREIFVVSSIAIVLGAAWTIWLVPQALVRLALVLATHSIYRLKVRGLEHVPQTGGCLLVPNHVSFADGLFMIASIDRPVRFLVDAPFFERPLIGTLLRWLDAIPISSTGGPRVILRALRSAGDHLDAGHVVCIFAEGQITRTGMLLPFRRGMERIVKGRNAPIVPVYLEGVWGSIFSFQGGRFVWKRPKRFPYPISVSFGEPLPAGTPIHAVRRAVQMLGQDAWRARYATAEPLHHTFVRRVRARPTRLLFADASRPKVSRLQALAGAIALGHELAPLWAGQRFVGILLPPSVGGALVNLAAAFAGRATVNLNYTTGSAGMTSASKQAGLRTVVTSRVFLEKAKLELPEGVQPLWLEEIAARIGSVGRVRALTLALFATPRWIERSLGAEAAVQPDDLVTVIFSSGSTGEPKGVMLAHSNVASNCAALDQIFHIGSREKVLGVLPFFHSFGFTATIWFPATSGLGAIYHPSPIDAAAIGELVERHSISFLLATPTLLSIYLRRIAPAQFGSLRLVLAGAEKLPERLVHAFEDHFGIRPLEGYGATECAPVVAASQLDFRAAGFYQPGWRRGFVGQPLPGIVCRVVDPDTFEDLAPNTPGMLLVRGPNVMKGYLGQPELTNKALRDGWYVTGDIAMLDDDSFLRITDRLSRFSKIGGEMVPHGRVEDELHKAAGAQTQVFVVTAVPDEKKGERLAVITTLPVEAIAPILAKLTLAGLPNLFVPRVDGFVHVATLPVLGTGKVDLRSAKQLALDAIPT